MEAGPTLSEIVHFSELPVGARFRFEHDPDHVWTKTDRREYSRANVKRIGSVLAPVIPEPFEVRTMNDNVSRYQNDPAFHTVVETLRLIIRSATLTPSEVREAAMTACVIEEMHRPAAPLTCSPEELEKIRRSWRTPYSSELAGRPGTRDVPSRPTNHDDGGEGIPNP